MIDFDGFKMINDGYGHAVGDDVLRRAASVIAAALRRSDFLARWGGEEFIAFFPKTQPAGAVRALSKALEVIREQRFQAVDGRTVSVTFSAGVSKVRETILMDEAIAEADRFLYRAKATGRNRVLSEESAGSRILLAESDELLAAAIEQRLKDEGFEVVRCTDGDSAMTAAQGTPFSLLIVDAKMPGMDGVEVLKRLRQIPVFVEIPIMLITSMAADSEVAQVGPLGVHDYIRKPFSMIELVARIQRLLNRTRTPLAEKPSFQFKRSSDAI
jgi:diguanylate cyclase (GGDEF)-like protein